MSQSENIYARPAAAYVIGAIKCKASQITKGKSIDDLDEQQMHDLIEIGRQSGFKMYRFKRSMELPRVKKVLGYLQGLNPEKLLDVGTGREVFLFPLLDVFPTLPATCLDIL